MLEDSKEEEEEGSVEGVDMGDGEGSAEKDGTVLGWFLLEDVDWINNVDLMDGRLDTSAEFTGSIRGGVDVG